MMCCMHPPPKPTKSCIHAAHPDGGLSLHPSLPFPAFLPPGRSQDDQVADIMSRIFEAKLMAPADRKFKKAKPGKKKLVKWPKTLEHVEVWLLGLCFVCSFWGFVLPSCRGVGIVGTCGTGAVLGPSACLALAKCPVAASTVQGLCVRKTHACLSALLFGMVVFLSPAVAAAIPPHPTNPVLRCIMPFLPTSHQPS